MIIAAIAEETNILSLSLAAVSSNVLDTGSSLVACCRKSELSHIFFNSSRLLSLSRMSL